MYWFLDFQTNFKSKLLKKQNFVILTSQTFLGAWGHSYKQIQKSIMDEQTKEQFLPLEHKK